MKVFFKPFFYLQFNFLIFWQKNIGTKDASLNVGEIDIRSQTLATLLWEEENFLKISNPTS